MKTNTLFQHCIPLPQSYGTEVKSTTKYKVTFVFLAAKSMVPSR